MAGKPQNLRKHGNVWHAHLKVNGQRIHFSTRATDLQTARKVLEEKRRELLEGQYRIQTRIPSLNELFDKWWAANHSVLGSKHLVTVECIFRKWVKPRLGATRIDLVTTQAVLEQRAHQLQAGCSGRYANNTLQVLRLLLTFAIRIGLISRLPFEVTPLRLQQPPRAVVPVGRVLEFLQLWNAETSDTQKRVMVRLMLFGGLRQEECYEARWAWLDPDHRAYTVGVSKSKRPRTIPIPAWMWDDLIALPRTTEWIFPAKDGKPHRPQFLKKTLAKVSDKFGLHITQHSLRRSAATLLHQAGASAEITRQFLGHADLSVLQRYLFPEKDLKVKAIEALGRQLGLHGRDEEPCQLGFGEAGQGG